MRSPASAVLTAALFLSSPAFAQDYGAQAEEIMGLSFDLDSIEGRLRAKPAARAPSPAAPAPYDAYAYSDAYVAPTPVAALPLEPNSDVDRVIVFADRAVVTRVLTVPATAGALEVTFEGLPLGLVATSLEGGVRSGAAEIIGVEVSSGAGKVEETARILAVKEEMLVVTGELGEIRDRIESLLAQRAYLRTAVLHSGREAPPPTLAQVRDTFGYVGTTEEDIARKLRIEQKRATELDEKLTPMLVKLDNPLATGLSVTVDLDVARAGDVTVALQYQVGGAWWSPTYNARLDPDAATVDLEYYGLVTNTTGDVWKDATLLLSTARPAESGVMPAVSPWMIGADAYGYPATVSGSMITGPGFYELASASPAPSATSGAAPSTSATVDGSGVVVFTIPGRRTVLGDGSAQRIPVRTQTLPATVTLATAPKLVPEVFRKARIRYDGSVPLIPGPVSSYVGPDYVGTGAIEAVVPGETLDLSFGADDRMQVTRQLISRHVERTGIGKNTVRYTFGFRVAVTNHTGRAQVVEVLDQLPVSQIESVTVKTIAVSAGLEPEEGDGPGLLRWRLPIEPGQTGSVTLEFSVTAPADAATSYLREMELMM